MSKIKVEVETHGISGAYFTGVPVYRPGEDYPVIMKGRGV